MPRFPLDVVVLSFDASSGQRQFGARRDGGARLHAACDLYAPHGTPIRAVADGVFKARKRFYQSTEALVVYHPGIGVVRYGEIMEASDYAREKRQIARANGGTAPKAAPAFAAGDEVKEGDILAHVGDLHEDSNFMLHFELYDEAAADDDLWAYKSNGKYGRHPLLLDPTPLLEALRRDGSIAPGLLPSGKMTHPRFKPPRGKGKKQAGLAPMSFPDGRVAKRDDLVFARLAPSEPGAARGAAQGSSSWDDAATLYRSTWRA